MIKKITSRALGAVLLALSFPAEAQQPSKVPKIGFLVDPSRAFFANRIELFRQGLHSLGYVEGKNIVIEYRYAEGKLDRLPDLAKELVGVKVDVMVTTSTQAVLAAKNATLNRAHCLHCSSRPRSDRAHRQPSASGRKRYGVKHPRLRVRRKETGATQRGSSKDHSGDLSLGVGLSSGDGHHRERDTGCGSCIGATVPID